MAPDGSEKRFAGAAGCGDDERETTRTGGPDDCCATEAKEARPNEGGPPEGRRPRRRSRKERAEIERLEAEIVGAASVIAAATHRFLRALRVFDERAGWEDYGRTCTADWLSWRTGMSMGMAREKVRVARALARVPMIDEALRDARISYSKARALTRVATPENQEALLAIAARSTAHELERACRRFRSVALDAIERRPPRVRTEERRVRFCYMDDGFVHIVVRAPPEEAAEVRAVLDAVCRMARGAARAARREMAKDADVPRAAEAGPAEPAAHYARAAAVERSTFNRVDALLEICRSYRESPRLAPGRLPRCEVFVEVGKETLAGTSDAPALLADGSALTPETAQRLACDAAVVAVRRDEAGRPLDVGRRSRAIPAAIDRALRLRDRWCRFPGCANTSSLDAHHLVHWARGGPTALHNLVRVCGHHHWCLHEGGFTAAEEDGRIVFRDPRGKVIENAPPLAPDGLPTVELQRWLQEHGPAPGRSLPIPIDGPVDWDGFLVGMIGVTYGDDPFAAGRRLPDEEGFPPPGPARGDRRDVSAETQGGGVVREAEAAYGTRRREAILRRREGAAYSRRRSAGAAWRRRVAYTRRSSRRRRRRMFDRCRATMIAAIAPMIQA